MAVTFSDDGINWEEPRITLHNNLESGWEDDINRNCVLKIDGKYKMWYTGQARGYSFIGYAESDDGLNFYRPLNEPVLISERAWEGFSVMNPCVLYENGIYRMWYAADGLSELANQKNITIKTDIAEDIMVNADEALLISAVSNLVSNGIKYSKDGGNINISAQKTEDGTELKIADDGIGITPENLEKIWERFYRVDDVRNDEYGSNGLGLSMVKAIVELHGGTVDVKSEIGKGTEFTIRLDM